jgi:hypothetical protein
MKVYGGECIDPRVVDVWLEATAQLHAPAALPGEKGLPVTHWTGSWMGPRTGLDGVEKRKFCSYRNSNSDLSAIRSLDGRYTKSRR